MRTVGVGCVGIGAGAGAGGCSALIGRADAVQRPLPLWILEAILAEPVGACLSCGPELGTNYRPTVGLLLPLTYHEDQRVRFLDVIRTNGSVILQGFAFMMMPSAGT